MSLRKQKHPKRSGGRFVMLDEWFQRTEAWATLKPGPRALYIELKRRYNGGNNGRISLSHREAATALNVSKNTVGAWFLALQERGFIRMMQAPHLGPSGIGIASLWALDEFSTDDMRTPPKRFASWPQRQKPTPKNGTPSPQNLDSNAEKKRASAPPVLKIVT